MTRPASASKSKPTSKPETAPVNATEPVISMKPRRGLFAALLVIFIVWIGFLVTLYFTTVYHKTDVHEQPIHEQQDQGDLDHPH